MQEGVTVATVVGIVGGLLIAAAFLAFVAANWTAIVRPARFATLPAGDLKGMTTQGRGTQVYVKLAPGADGHFEAVSVHAAPVPVTGKEC